MRSIITSIIHLLLVDVECELGGGLGLERGAVERKDLADVHGPVALDVRPARRQR